MTILEEKSKSKEMMGVPDRTEPNGGEHVCASSVPEICFDSGFHLSLAGLLSSQGGGLYNLPSLV